LCTMQFADMIEGDSGEKVRWLFSLLSMHRLMDDFQISLEKRVDLFNAAKTSFGKEFNRSGRLNKQINELYAENENEIEKFLNANAIDEDYMPLWDILQHRSENIKNSVIALKKLNEDKQLPTSLNEIILSYLHMICNRIFLSKHRVHEMVVYDFMYKYYSKQMHLVKDKKEVLETTN
jgi:lantibiotic biosynthesis protein